MKTDFLALLYELELPIRFTFGIEEIPIYDPPHDINDPDEPPFINEIRNVLVCRANIELKSFNIEEYRIYLKGISEATFRAFEIEVMRCPNPMPLLKNFYKRIQVSQLSFKLGHSGISRAVKDTFNIRIEDIEREEYFRLFQPFYQVQFNTLNSFNERLKNKFSIGNKLEAKKYGSKIEFRYAELYHNPSTKREVTERLEDLLADLKDFGFVVNRGIKSLLYYFGLTSSETKIQLNKESYQGDFYTFFIYLKKKKVASGHDPKSLPNYVEHASINVYSVDWRTQKHTKNRDQIEKKLQKFIDKMNELESKYSS